MFTVFFAIACLIFWLAYVKYGKFLARIFELNNRNRTPAHTICDGVDYLPAPGPVLFGHHFSSIAGAGPILGPIIAGLAFGWLPVWLWIIIGSIFIGGVHDFSALVISIRNRGKSIAEIANIYMSKRAYRLMLIFIWLALVYVLTVFTDLTAVTFTNDAGVATSSLLFILLAIGFGITLYRFKFPLIRATGIFVVLLFFSVWLGQQMPLSNFPVIFGDPVKTWNLILIVYCFVASVTPVWVLLQPRDYLSSFLLYSSILGGFLGILFGGITLKFPAFYAWNDAQLGSLFPLLFITVACGAISGFHSIVASGTTAKQINRQSDALPIGYGGMLVEGLVAVIALATVMMISPDNQLTKQAPLVIYGAGMAKFFSIFGIPQKYGNSFGILALSTFILTTLDTATRLARYILQEFFGWAGKNARYPATALTLLLPAVFVIINFKNAQGVVVPVWKIVWPIFGATNQLLAGLALLVVSVWLKKNNKPVWFAVLPMCFILAMTLWALIMIIQQYKLGLLGIIGDILLLLSLLLIWEALKIFEIKSYLRRLIRAKTA